MRQKIKYIVCIISIMLFILCVYYIYKQNNKTDINRTEIRNSNIENVVYTGYILDVIIIPYVEFKDLGIIANGIIQLIKDSTAIVIPRPFRTNASIWLKNDTRLINDNLYYMLQIYESFDLNLKNNITKNIIYTYSSNTKAYSLVIVNSLERKRNAGEAKLPNEITEKDFQFMLSKYSKIYYLVQKEHVLSKLDNSLIKQAKKKKIPLIMYYY